LILGPGILPPHSQLLQSRYTCICICSVEDPSNSDIQIRIHSRYLFLLSGEFRSRSGSFMIKKLKISQRNFSSICFLIKHCNIFFLCLYEHPASENMKFRLLAILPFYLSGRRTGAKFDIHRSPGKIKC